MVNMEAVDDSSGENIPLTRYPEGSVRELFAISFPLMLSILSSNLMMFFDRFILFHYSIEALNAAAAAGMFGMAFHFGAIGIASMGQVIIGQLNGARKYEIAAQPAWQMVWFAVLSSLIFVPVAMWGGPFLLSDYYYEEFGLPYFKWLHFLGPLFPMQAALAAFFCGIGRVRLVTITTIIGNIANIFLACLLVFGFSPFIPSLGTKGAAIAQGLSQLIQIVILLSQFFHPYFVKKYNTLDFSFKPKLFKKCICLGFPTAVGGMIEVSAWALMTRMLITVDVSHVTVIAIGQSLYSLVAFGVEGLQKGLTTVATNFIGAKKLDKVILSWWSAVKLLILFALIVSSVMLFYPDLLIHNIVSKDTTNEEMIKISPYLRMICIYVWVYCILDGLTWISAGILTAAGDTLFVMMMNGASAWLFALIPIYIFVVRFNGSPALSWALFNSYALINALCFYWRYRGGSWKKISIA
jgi:MATE family multidrug resistance protein